MHRVFKSVAMERTTKLSSVRLHTHIVLIAIRQYKVLN